MKKLLSVFLCLLFLVSLTGCISYHHKALMLYGESPVASVELYDLPVLYGGLKDFFESGKEGSVPVKQLPADRMDGFLSEVTTWKYTDTVILLPVAQDSPREFGGYAVKVTYENGNWEIFDSDFCVYFDGKEEHRKLGSVDWDLWDDLLWDFFEVRRESGGKNVRTG